MALREDQRRAFEEIVKGLADDDEARSILRTMLDAKDTAKALDDAGAQRKSVAEETTATITVTATDSNGSVVTKDAPVTNPGSATQYAHGPEGIANHPPENGKAAGKCPNCDHPKHSGTCGVKGCDCKGGKEPVGDQDTPAKAVAVDIEDKLAADIAKFVHEEAVREAETQRDEVAKQINDALTKMVGVIQALQERVDALEGTEKAIEAQYEQPRIKTAYEKLVASRAKTTEITEGDPLAKEAAKTSQEREADAADLENAGSAIFHAAGLK